MERSSQSTNKKEIDRTLMEKIQEFSEAGIIKNKEHLNPDGLGL